MIEVVNSPHGIPVSYCLSYGVLLIIFQGLTSSLIGQPGSFALPAVMRDSRVALLL